MLSKNAAVALEQDVSIYESLLFYGGQTCLKVVLRKGTSLYKDTYARMCKDTYVMQVKSAYTWLPIIFTGKATLF